MNKRVVISLFCLFVSILLISEITALGIIPARISINFEPGLEKTIEFTVSGASKVTRTLEVVISGELAEYITVDKSNFNLQEDMRFIVTIKLPDELKPGRNTAYIGVSEEIDMELVGGMFGTAIVINSLFAVDVPYPGKYLESTLTAENVNIGEPVLFMLGVKSQGADDVVMKPVIEIYSEHDELMETLEFKEREILSQEKIDLQKALDTNDYTSGRYYAVAKVNYEGSVSDARTDFRIGELVVNVLGYTNKTEIGGMKKFVIKIESGWNDVIDGAYAEVTISNSTDNIVSFKTSPTNINPWQIKSIEGYFNSDLFSEGEYDVDIIVNYFGRDKGRTVGHKGKILFYMPDSINYLLIIIVIGSVLFLMFFLIILGIIFKNGKKKR